MHILEDLQAQILDECVQFSKEWQILLFHYDGKVTEWDEYEWSQKAIHISVRKQAKWCALTILRDNS